MELIILATICATFCAWSVSSPPEDETRAIVRSPWSAGAGAVSEGAGGWSRGIVRVRAEGAQSGLGIGNAQHGERAGFVLAVERRGLGRVEVACGQGGRILGIVKPEAQMERVGRSQAHVGVEPEDVIQENRLDLTWPSSVALPILISD